MANGEWQDEAVRRRRTWQAIGILVAIGMLVGCRAAPAAQTSNAGVLVDFLTEVRGLRAAMEQMASAGPRIQLATARLQLQEQRINSLARRVDDVRASIRNRQDEATQLTRRYQQLESAAAQSPNRDQVDLELKAIRAAVSQAQSDVQRLQGEDADLSQQIAIEQGRWTDINQRLEELDRALARK